MLTVNAKCAIIWECVMVSNYEQDAPPVSMLNFYSSYRLQVIDL